MDAVVRERTVRARKAHRCQWCHTLIATGAYYMRATVKGDDGLYDFVNCVKCEDIRDAVHGWCTDPDEGMSYSDFEEWAREHCNDPTMGEHARAYLARCPSRNVDNGGIDPRAGVALTLATSPAVDSNDTTPEAPVNAQHTPRGGEQHGQARP